MARYTSIYSSVWENPQIQELLEEGHQSTVLLYFYLMTNSCTNIIGYYRLNETVTAANLCTTAEEITNQIMILQEKKLLEYDSEAKTILILDFFAHNPCPKGEKQLKGMNNQLKQIGRSSLDTKFIHQVCKYADDDANVILEAMPNKIKALNLNVNT